MTDFPFMLESGALRGQFAAELPSSLLVAMIGML
jgi:hypothetical protein